MLVINFTLKNNVNFLYINYNITNIKYKKCIKRERERRSISIIKNKYRPLFVKAKRLSHLSMLNFCQSGLREFLFRFNNPLNNSDFIKNAEAKLGFLFETKERNEERDK